MKQQRDPSEEFSRRQFFGQAGCAALSSVSILSTLMNLKMAGNAAAASLPPGDDTRSMVCLFLSGGNDSFNMLVPSGAGYAEYQASRSNLALPKAQLLPLNLAESAGGLNFGLHPSMPEVQELFNGIGRDPNKRRLSFVANLGTLIQPLTLAQYDSGDVPVPKALFSHSDQTDQWQTSLPQGVRQFTGWAGRAADVLHSRYNTGKVSMSISLSGNNLLQTGSAVTQFVITPSGSLTFTGPSDASDPTNPLWLKNRSLNSLMEQRYTNLLADSFAGITRDSIQAQRQFQSYFDSFDDSAVRGFFPVGYLGDSMRAVVKSIAIRKQLGLRRQTFFVSFGGWDHHFELLDAQGGMLSQLSKLIGGYQKALEALGLANDVITFTASDFGRTLRSNGRGTDHAWGGHQMVFGGSVKGGRVHGTFPSLALNGPDDVGYGGRILPSTSVDQYFCEMLQWFGVSPSDMEYVLPNIRNFYNPASATPPLGFLKRA